MTSLLPEISEFDSSKFAPGKKRLLLTAEGFEARSTAWLKVLPKETFFQEAYVCRYLPEKKARLTELLSEVTPRTIHKPLILEFHRFDPTIFEHKLNSLVEINSSNFDEIVLDISVMSKLLIILIIWSLRKYEKILKIIYTEPDDYAPSKGDYEKQKDAHGKSIILPSYGVHEVVRTPQLSSVIMQRYPDLVLTFASFNEQLIRSLLSSINPSRLFLINGIPPHLSWREKATQEIHKEIIKEYSEDNIVDKNTGLLSRRTSTLYYKETFELLAQIYRDFCYHYRIVLAPTGSKMQSVSCALFKICCPDIHIEYPTPESFFITGYSSEKTKTIHEINFDSFISDLKSAGDHYELNG